MATNPPRQDGNGCTWWKDWLRPGPVLTVLAILFAATMTWAAVQGHCADTAVHHTTEQLDGKYVRRDVLEPQLAEIKRQLTRIEDKVDGRP
jgi:hypothetical protein